MKAPSPLLGFNNNVRHKGRVFHIQTEDSGIRHPHIITHLFADGGRILKTTKTSYAEHIGQERLAETVRGMMQDQHKAMFIALRDGQFDYLFDESGSGPGSTKAPSRAVRPTPPAQPAAAVPEPPPAVTVTMGGPEKSPQTPPINDGGSAPAPLPENPKAAAQPVIATPAQPEPPRPPAQPAIVASPKPIVVQSPVAASAFDNEAVSPPRPSVPRPSVASPGNGPRPVVMPRPAAHFAPTEPAQPAAVYEPPPPPSPLADTQASRRRGVSRPTLDVDPGALHGVGSGEPAIDLDLDALERAAAEAQTPFFQQIQDLPPPPASVLGAKRAAAGGYSVRSPMPPPLGVHRSHDGGPGRASSPPPAAAQRSAAVTAATATGVPAAPSPGRYAPSRPASIFATTRPQEGASIFGEDLISEKSLDEVILGYLAEDLDGPAEKK